MTAILIAGLILLLILGIVLFINTSPQFGGKLTKELKSSYTASNQWNGDNFTNVSETNLDMPLGTIVRVIAKQFEKIPNRRPSERIEIMEPDLEVEVADPRLTWFGHSTFLVE